ncbi:TniB family NTP-binding protein [Phaeobacter inhibens]|uniref:TniB family NTP-binding protein n=1 Tax=Phaeobacter inhibens TaxID=221822 RepID=UPI000C9B9BA7|nr:TniB family NTP-binding protein [Phaeobacter inhibens]AUQ65721.1 hypothetical protein PhaeoP78_00830 [Phaeobacter inhibens]
MNSTQPTCTAAPDVSNLQTWLADRYFRLDRDEALADCLTDIFTIDGAGALTATPVRDPLNGETAGLMLIGDSGSGKSSLLRRMLRTNPAFSVISETSEGNTLFETVKPAATIKSLAITIAERTGYTKMKSNIHGDEAWEVARHRMSVCGVSLLVIDEAHHLLRKGSGRDTEGAVQTMKNLLQGDSSVAVILSGVQKLYEGVLSDPETDRRFIKMRLRRIQEGSGEAHRFGLCVVKCAQHLGLDLPAEMCFAERVLFAENGDAGRSIRLAKQTLRRAMIMNRRAVDLSDAALCFEKIHLGREAAPFASGDWSTIRENLESMGWVR